MCLLGRRGASGQATLEYLFLIFFTIVLISGFVYRFNGAVKAYFDGYFSPGGYLACLIQNGILPGETGDNGDCNPPTFNMQNGQKRQVADVDFGAGTNSRYGGGAGVNGISSGSSSRLNEGGGNIVPGGSASKGAFKKNDGKGGVSKKGPNTGDEGFSTSEGGSGGGEDEGGTAGGSRRRRIPYRDRSNTNANVKAAATVPTMPRDLKTPREIAAEKEKKLKEKEEGKGFDLSFGNIIKWIFLILILFAIFFFIGSQIMAVANGNKKRR